MRISDWSSDVCSSDLYLRLQLAKARRERFGRSSERAGDLLAQLPLSLGDVATAESSAHVVDPHKPLPKKQARPPQRHSLPEFLPREEHVLAANDSCDCPACGGTLTFKIGRASWRESVCRYV